MTSLDHRKRVGSKAATAGSRFARIRSQLVGGGVRRRPNALWRIWVLDVDGVRVVVRADSFPGTTPQVQAQLRAIVDSIQIEP